MFRVENKTEYMNELSHCSLLIIDKLGLERSSEYALGIIFYVIDHRYRSGKPLITTTNLPLKEIKGKANRHEKIRQQSPGKGKLREKALKNISGIFEHKEQKQTQGQQNRQHKMNFPGSE